MQEAPAGEDVPDYLEPGFEAIVAAIRETGSRPFRGV
jgi:hypothetical protein